jgi:hypothetical protein
VSFVSDLNKYIKQEMQYFDKTDALTPSMTALSIMAFSIMTLSVKSLGIKTLNIMPLSNSNVTKNLFCGYAESHSDKCYYGECHYAECHYAKCHYTVC